MKRNVIRALVGLSVSSLALFGGGCDGYQWLWRMLGDAVGDTFAYNIFLD